MTTTAPDEAGERPDGRSLRAERTRSALVQALLDLLDSGEVRPTAETIAARARVSPRTVFQHFPDRDGLVAAAAAAQEERVRAMIVPVDVALPLPRRLDAFLDQRVEVLETVSGMRRAAILLEPFSDVVAGKLRLVRAAARAEVAHVFAAEIAAVPGRQGEELLDALAAAAAWPSWDSLRRHQGLDPVGARAVVRRTLAALLGV